MGRDISSRQSPPYRQRMAQLLTGYGPIWLRREGDFAVVLVQSVDGKEWVEIIREHVDGAFSHIIEPTGIEAEMNKAAKA